MPLVAALAWSQLLTQCIQEYHQSKRWMPLMLEPSSLRAAAPLHYQQCYFIL